MLGFRPIHPSRVADVGCARAGQHRHRPQLSSACRRLDLDAPAVELGKANASEAGLSDRVTFHARDAADPRLAGRYDLVTAFECIHDMSNPVSVLRAMRGCSRPAALSLS
jgi:2-polyprenyl-3-methyl-5-hydroxy-6-metoxy-1,4-benzoquinol methylase